MRYVEGKGKAVLGIAGEDISAACRQDYILINQVNVLYAVSTKIFRRGTTSLCDGGVDSPGLEWANSPQNLPFFPFSFLISLPQ